MNTKYIGNIGEDLAVKALEDKGYKVIERNANYAGCEMDIILECYIDESGNLIKNYPNRISKIIQKLFKINSKTKGERLIVFCEVKTRYDDTFGTPEEAVTGYKVARYVKGANAYLSAHSIEDVKVRFDIFAISQDTFEHIENAFSINDAKY